MKIPSLLRPGGRLKARPSLQKKPEAITFGGRAFYPMTESTVEHDFRLMALLREVGLDQPMRLEAETPADYGNRLLRDLIASRRALDVLGHLLVPEGTPPREWSVEVAMETAAYLGGLVSPGDKQRVHALTLEFLLGFFQLELDSLKPSQISSDATESRAAKRRKREVKRVVRLGTGRS